MLHGLIFYRWLSCLSPFGQFFCRLAEPLLFFSSRQQELQQRQAMLSRVILPCRPLLTQCPLSCNVLCYDSHTFLPKHTHPVSSIPFSCPHQTSIHEFPSRSFVLYIFRSAWVPR